MKKLNYHIAHLRAIFFAPYEVVNIEQMHYNKALIEAALFCIKCINSCYSYEQLKTCSSIMHTHLTCRYIAHPLYIKYWVKVLKCYHFRLKLIDLMQSTN